MPNTFFSPLPDFAFHINPAFRKEGTPDLITLEHPGGRIDEVELYEELLAPHLTAEQLSYLCTYLRILRYVWSVYAVRRVRVYFAQPQFIDYLPTDAAETDWEKGLPILDFSMIWQDRAPPVMGRPIASDVEQELQEAIKVNVIRLLSVVGDRAPAALDRPHATTVELEMAVEEILTPGATLFGFEAPGDGPSDGDTPIVMACIRTGNALLTDRYGGHTLAVKNRMRAEGAALAKEDIRRFWLEEIDQLQALMNWRLAMVQQTSALRARRASVAKTFEKHPAMEPHERPSMYRPTIRGMTNEAEIREGRMPTLRQMVRIAMTTGVRKGLSAYTPYQWQMPLLYAAAHVGELCYARGETTLDTSVGAAGLFAVVLNEEFSLGGRDTHWNVDEEMSECSRGIYDAILPAQREARLEFGNLANEAVFKKTPVLLKVDDFSQRFVVLLKFPTSPQGE